MLVEPAHLLHLLVPWVAVLVERAEHQTVRLEQLNPAFRVAHARRSAHVDAIKARRLGEVELKGACMYELHVG